MLGVSEWCFGRSDEMCERSVVLSRHCVAFVAVQVADVLLSQVAFVALDLDLETRLDKLDFRGGLGPGRANQRPMEDFRLHLHMHRASQEHHATSACAAQTPLDILVQQPPPRTASQPEIVPLQSGRP